MSVGHATALASGTATTAAREKANFSAKPKQWTLCTSITKCGRL
ncbi:hypothetical protein [Hominenteromicrobium sp.]